MDDSRRRRLGLAGVACVAGAGLSALGLEGCSGDNSSSPDSGASADTGAAADSRASTDGTLTETGSAQDAGSDLGVSSDTASSNADAGDGGAAATQTALFIFDNVTSVTTRYWLAADGGTPVLDRQVTVAAGGDLGTVRPTGELLLSNTTSTIARYLDPLGALTPNGIITGAELNLVDQLASVDDEVWALDTGTSGGGCCGMNAEPIVRFAFDSSGNATVVGTVSTGLIGNNRGIVWNPATRDLFVSQCCGSDTILHFRVAPDKTVTALAPITGNGLNSPHYMVITPWGELLVANRGGYGGPCGTSVLRFTIDAQGNATANGSITGPFLSCPVLMRMTPWGELFVSNGDISPGTTAPSVISRFTFDSSHSAMPNGTWTPCGSHYCDVGMLITGSPPAPLDAGPVSDGSSAKALSDAASE
jgi:hypothetical protein